MNVHQAVPANLRLVCERHRGAVSSTAPAPAPAPAPAKAPKVTTKRGLKLNEAGKAKVRHAVKKATTLEDLGEIDKALDSGRISDELATRLELISSDFEAARTPAALPLGAQVLTPGGLMKVRSFIEQATDLDRLAEVDKALNAGDVFRLQIMLNLQPQDIREPGEEPEEVEEDYDPFATLPSAEASVFSATQEGLATTAELDEAFANFLESPGWRELQTRTARRLCDGSYTFDGDCNKPPPPHLPTCLQYTLHSTALEKRCLYEDGQDLVDACPNHVHDCRQLTLSLGAERFVAVEGEKMLMRHGDVIILDGERLFGTPLNADGTHLNAAGIEAVAELLKECVKAEGTVEYEWGDEGARAAELLAMRVRPAWGKGFASAWGFAKHIWWVLHEPALHKDRRVRSRATKFFMVTCREVQKIVIVCSGNDCVYERASKDDLEKAIPALPEAGESAILGKAEVPCCSLALVTAGGSNGAFGAAASSPMKVASTMLPTKAEIGAKEGPPKKKAKEKKLKRARSKQDGGLGNLQSAYDESSGGSAEAADPSKRKRQKSAEELPAPPPQELAWPMAWAWLLSRTRQHPEFRAPPILSGTKWAEEAAPHDAAEPRLAIAITTSLVYAGDVASGYDPRHLARVVAVDQSGKLLLDLTVRPRSKLLDCRTHITGLSKEALEGPEAVSFDEARAQLLELLRPRTILVGHRLSQDLEALQLWHGPLLDISLLFPVDTRKKYQYHPLPYIGERVLLIAAPPEDSDLGPQDAIEMARLAMRLAVHEAAQPAPTNPFEPRQSSGREMVVRHIPASWGKAAVERLVEAIPGVSSDVKVRWMLNETDPTDWRGEARVFFTSARGRDDSFRASRGLTDVHVQWEDAPGAPPLGAFLTEQALIEAFSSFGMVVCARIPRRPTTQEPQSFAFVSFLDCEDAHRVSKKPAVEVPITGTWTVELRPRLAKFGNSSDKRHGYSSLFLLLNVMAQRMMASVQHQVAQALIQMNPASFKTKEKSLKQAQTSASLIPRSPVEKHANGGCGEAPVILLNGEVAGSLAIPWPSFGVEPATSATELVGRPTSQLLQQDVNSEAHRLTLCHSSSVWGSVSFPGKSTDGFWV
eukprot:s1718_g9.t2